ncbi:hypothetical protein EVAR_69797_1 [Eumeta japonica]|uniref:Uncharacterized protein n=1 Tax=Eumeta variegata TaxID=151549 RepID=A0A4C1SE32_EUMVA|nr:hypothetical protein EVAR_69797_1 [Eumeta japonica]
MLHRVSLRGGDKVPQRGSGRGWKIDKALWVREGGSYPSGYIVIYSKTVSPTPSAAGESLTRRPRIAYSLPLSFIEVFVFTQHALLWSCFVFGRNSEVRERCGLKENAVTRAE